VLRREPWRVLGPQPEPQRVQGLLPGLPARGLEAGPALPQGLPVRRARALPQAAPPGHRLPVSQPPHSSTQTGNA